MASRVGVETAQVELQQYGSVEFPVHLDGKRHGRLRIDRRGISWASGGSKKERYELSWKQFGTIMEERGKKKTGALGSPRHLRRQPSVIHVEGQPELLVGALHPAGVGVLDLHDGGAHDLR